MSRLAKRMAGLLLLLYAFTAGVCWAETPEDLSFLKVGKAAKKTAIIYNEARRSSGEIARIQGEEGCEIIGSVEKYYHVRFEGKTGYIPKNALSVEVVRANVAEALCDSVSLNTATPNRHAQYLEFQGVITAEEPLETLVAYIWDERQNKIEQVYTYKLDPASQRIDTAVLAKMLPTNKLTGGRKQLVLEGCAAKETVVLFRSPLYTFGELQDPVHVTHQCKGVPGVLKDEMISTAWVPKKSKPSLRVEIPQEAKAVLLTLEWKSLPSSFEVELLDEKGKLISKEEKSTGFYTDSVGLSQAVRTIIITPKDKTAALGNLRVYGEGYPAHEVQTWDAMPEKIDLLLISAHQDDEFLFFGGTIPYYAAREDVTIGVLYMADCGRARYREALDGLWTAGLRHYPIFLDLEDFYTLRKGEAAWRWRNDDPGRRLVQAIRRYKPDVIVTHDFNGEYGHGQHEYTAQLAAESLALAADGSYDPESADRWGTWQVKKMYSHLYENNQITMDWNTPLDDSGVITPMFLAWEGYDKSKSQLAAFSMERDGVKYNNALFGLYWSAVGPDINKNDFMENVF